MSYGLCRAVPLKLFNARTTQWKLRCKGPRDFVMQWLGRKGDAFCFGRVRAGKWR